MFQEAFHLGRRLPVLMSVVLFFQGCGTLDSMSPARPGESEYIQVKSGDRISFELNEASESCRWDFTCDDSDVEVRLDRIPPEEGESCGKAAVLIRVRRGYDGPSNIRFFCRGCGRSSKPLDKAFTISLFKRTGDVAFWE